MLSLNLFDFFCKETYQKNGDEVILDIENIIKQDANYARLFRLSNSFILWLQEDQPDCIVKKHLFSISIKKHNPSSNKRIIIILRQYIEEFRYLEFSERKFRRMVRLPKEIEEESESFKKEETRDCMDILIHIDAIQKQLLKITVNQKDQKEKAKLLNK